MRFDLRRMIIFILCWMLVSAVIKYVVEALGLGMMGYIFLIGLVLIIVFKFNTIKYFCWRLKNSIRVPYKRTNISTESSTESSNKAKSILDRVEL